MTKKTVEKPDDESRGIKVQFYLSAEEKEALEQQAKANDRTLSGEIRHRLRAMSNFTDREMEIIKSLLAILGEKPQK